MSIRSIMAERRAKPSASISAVSISTTRLNRAGCGKQSASRRIAGAGEARVALAVVALDDQRAGLVDEVEVADGRRALGRART
jgi:hypothetical protein